MARILDNYRSLGQQESEGVFKDNTGNSPKLDGTLNMSEAAAPNAQGEEFEICIRLADQSVEANRQHFEIMVATYDLASSVYTWNRERVIKSSNSNLAVDWGALVSGNDSLVMYGVTSSEQYEGERILQKGKIKGEDVSQWGAFIVDHNSTTSVGATDNTLIITPKKETSELYYNMSMTLETQQSGAIGSGIRSRVEVKRVNASGVFVDATDYNSFGFFNMPTSDSDSAIRSNVSISDSLTSSEKSASGDWKLKPYVKILDANTKVSLLKCTLTWMEIG